MTRLRTNVGFAILVGFVLRLAIAPWFHGFQYDMYIYGNWAENLVSRPLGDFYAFAESPDHLPGDLYLHWILGHSFQLFGGENFYGPAYRFVLKAFPSLIDCLLILLAYRFVRDRATQDASLKLVWMLSLAPALVFISAAWGQWDTVSATFFLAGLLLLWNDRARPLAASILFGWALLIKPPLLLLVIPAVVGYAWRKWQEQKSPRTLVGSLVGMASVAFVTVSALMFPFGMTWLKSWGDISLQGQLEVAAELYPFTTLGAANIWMIPLGRPDRVSDTQTFMGVSPQIIGMFLMVLAVCWIVYRSIKSRLSPTMLIWAMAAMSYAYFLLPTRSHERYLFPAIILLAILAALTSWRPQITRIFWLASITYFINLVVVYRMPPGIFGTMVFEVLSVANIVAFVWLLFLASEEIEPTIPSRPGVAQRAP